MEIETFFKYMSAMLNWLFWIVFGKSDFKFVVSSQQNPRIWCFELSDRYKSSCFKTYGL